ncbi:MAG: type II toxin-antitoxin system RelE/ParE family toxin [Patescibacteria group bacterium]
MIISFKNSDAEDIFNQEYSKNLPFFIQKTAMRKLWMLDASVIINDLRIPPGNHLKKLKGQQLNQYSIRINDQWRICFNWDNGNAIDVEIVDYHK